MQLNPGLSEYQCNARALATQAGSDCSGSGGRFAEVALADLVSAKAAMKVAQLL